MKSSGFRSGNLVFYSPTDEWDAGLMCLLNTLQPFPGAEATVMPQPHSKAANGMACGVLFPVVPANTAVGRFDWQQFP